MRLSKMFKAMCTTKAPDARQGKPRTRSSPEEVARAKRQRDATSELAAFMNRKGKP